MKCCECPIYVPNTENYRWCQGTYPNNIEHDCKHGESVKGKKFKIKKEESLDE